MKKNSLSTAIVAGVAGVAGLAGMANAVNLNPDGLGQVLIYPYYTVNGDNSTLISVVNTTANAKAVKVRFLESLNSAEVLDFNLYLSGFDVWTASVVRTDDGASLFTSDTTCTVPNNVGKGEGGTPFRPFEFANNSPDVIGLTGAIRLGGAFGQLVEVADAERMRQGHIEMIEMGELQNENVATNTSNSRAVADADGGFNPRAWATHAGAAGARVPNNCAALQAAWNTTPAGVWTATNGEEEVSQPTGGLFGGATIVDVSRGRALTYNADAIDGFYRSDDLGPDGTTPLARTFDLHAQPGDTLPNLAQARTGQVGGVDVAVARVFDNGVLATATYANGLDAVSAVLMNRFIFNEYNLDAGLQAASEWVITFPTKRLHTYGVGVTDPRPFSDWAPGNTSTSAPNVYIADFEPADDDFEDGRLFDTYGLCDVISIRWWDREERTTGTAAVGTDVSPRPPGGFVAPTQLCWESNVLAFNQTLTATTPTFVLGAQPTQGATGLNIGTSFVDGWARIEFDDPRVASFQNYLLSDDAQPVALVGLPVTGFWAADYLNENVAAGVRANFSGIHKHRGDRDIYVLGVGATAPAAGAPFNAGAAGVSQFTGS